MTPSFLIVLTLSLLSSVTHCLLVRNLKHFRCASWGSITCLHCTSDSGAKNDNEIVESNGSSSGSLTTAAQPSLHETLREHLSHINEHSSHIAVKTSLEAIFAMSKGRNIPERFYYQMMDSCLKRKSDTFAVDVFRQMTSLNIPCTSHQLTSLLQISENLKISYEERLQIFDSAVAVGLDATVHNFSPLLKSCGSAKRARQILARMQLAKIEPNVISFSAAIKSCEQTGDWQSSIELLELMRAYGVAPNEITYCCIISAASKGWAGDIAVSILREMTSAGVPPNHLCYACAITASARCKNWRMVEKLLNEMEYLNMPIQESVVISVINCCRSSIRPPRHVMNTEDLADYSKNEWAKALWIVNRWAGKTERVTESLYTIAMDVCQEANRYREVVQLYFTMLEQFDGPAKSSLSFAFRACEKLKDPDIAVKLLVTACEKGVSTNALTGMVIGFCASLGRIDRSMEAYEIAYKDDLVDESKFVPITNTRRLVSDALDWLTRPSLASNETASLSPEAEAYVYATLKRIVPATLRGNKLMLETEDFERFVSVLIARREFSYLQAFLKRSVNSSFARIFLSVYEFTVAKLCLTLPFEEGVGVMTDFTNYLHVSFRSRTANHITLHMMSTLYNNVTTSAVAYEGGSHRRVGRLLLLSRERLIFRLYKDSRDSNVNDKAAIPLRTYRIAALACRDGGLEDEMLALFQDMKDDGIVDRAVLSHVLYLLSKSKVLWRYGLEAFQALRGLREPPDSYMYTSAVVACETGRDWSMALELLGDMERDGYKMNTFVMTTAITACAVCGQTDEALGLLAKMRRNSIECSAWTFNAAMFACAKVGKWREALNVYEMMRSYMHNESIPVGEAAEVAPALSSEDEDADDSNFKLMQSAVLDMSAKYLRDGDVDQDEGEVLESYMAAFDTANIVTYNTLIEALGEGGQYMLVDDIYQDAVGRGIVSPFKDFRSKGWIDLHYHSVHMGHAAMRYLFETLLLTEEYYSVLVNDKGNEMVNEIIVIIGKGDKLQKAIQTQLRNDFRPPIKSSVAARNTGRLVLCSKDVVTWLNTHRALRG